MLIVPKATAAGPSLAETTAENRFTRASMRSRRPSLPPSCLWKRAIKARAEGHTQVEFGGVQYRECF